MERLRIGPFALASLLLGSSAQAQSFNVDYNSTFGSPSSAYGAGSGQTGTWNNKSPAVPSAASSLVDIAGAATGVTIETKAGPNGWNGFQGYSWNNPNTSGDDQALMDDLLDAGGGFPAASGVEITVKNLAADTYDVYVYCFGPDNYLPGNGGFAWQSLVTVAGATSGQQSCGSLDWPAGGHAQGLTYTKHTIALAAAQDLSILVESDLNGGGFASVNGIQIVKGVIPCLPATTYCTNLISSSGCSPAIGASGTPSASNPTGFTVTATNLEVGQNGLMFFGTTGPNNAPFFGGTLCVNPSLYRLTVANAGGGAACTGSLSNTLSDMIAHPTGGPLVVPGTTVNAQVWTRDPPAATTVSLTNGVEFLVCP
jgi:hypothetical protein